MKGREERRKEGRMGCEQIVTQRDEVRICEINPGPPSRWEQRVPIYIPGLSFLLNFQ